MTSAVILAAGAGRRLGELGLLTSKAMVPVLGRPLVRWVIERLYEGGVDAQPLPGHGRDEDFAVIEIRRARGVAQGGSQLLLDLTETAEGYAAVFDIGVEV